MRQSDPVKIAVAAPIPVPSPQPIETARPVASPPPLNAANSALDLTSAAVSAVPSPRATRGRGEPIRTALPKEPAAAPVQPRASISESAPVTPAPRALEPRAPAPSTSQAALVTVVDRALSAFDEFPESDYAGPGSASRLGGIRNLLVTLGRRSLGEDTEFKTDESQSEPRFDRAIVCPAYAEPYAPDTESRLAVAGSAPIRVTAQPEFLRPRTISQVEKEEEPVQASVSSPRWEPADDIQTLPSVRGQYRRKQAKS